mgnify:FL=1|tara:strand:+ start:480 stop:869 length:390 start_codon:yes stop_codon:yes gene_type:complete
MIHDNVTFDQIEYDSNKEDKRELEELLKKTRVINEIQSELASIIDIQDTDINEINETMESTSQITSKATEQLEIASGRKFTFKPLVIGAAALSLISLPISISAGATAATVGYVAGGSAVLGGYFGKKMA